MAGYIGPIATQIFWYSDESGKITSYKKSLGIQQSPKWTFLCQWHCDSIEKTNIAIEKSITLSTGQQ